MEETIKNWIIDEASDDELLQIVSEVNDWDDSLEEYRFYYMDELNEFYCGVKPTEVLEKLADGFNVNDDGFKETIHGLESCSQADMVEDIRHNADEIAIAIANVLEHIDADGLKNYLEDQN